MAVPSASQSTPKDGTADPTLRFRKPTIMETAMTTTPSATSGVSRRGFASLTPERRQEIARMGGAAVPPERRAFAQSRDLAREAGRKGGISTHARKP